MVRTINSIDRNFHESFSAKGFRYFNVTGGGAPGSGGSGGDALPTALPNSAGSTTTVSGAPPPTTAPPASTTTTAINSAPRPRPVICPVGYIKVGGKCVPASGGKPSDSLPPSIPDPTPVSYPAAGTLLGTYCAGLDKIGKYADGRGGYTTAIFEKNSAGCGYVAPTPTPTPTPTPGPMPGPLPSDQNTSGPVYPPLPGGEGGGYGPGGGGGYEEPVSEMEETATALPAEEINWPAIAIAGALVGLTYWYMGQEKAAA